jgi:hypothetical protein
MNTTINAPVLPATEQTVPQFGNGRYGDFQRTLYKDSQTLFGLSQKAAEKFARAAATDFGQAMAHASVEAKVGKATGKDMKITLSEAAKLKNVTSSPALSLVHAIQWAGEAGKHGVSFGKTSWILTPDLQDYVTDLE